MNKTINDNGMPYRIYDNHKRTGVLPLKVWLVMKFIAIYILVFSVMARGAVHGQRIDLHVTNASFKTVIQQLQKQSGYSFSVNERHMKKAHAISLSVQSMQLAEVLPKIFEGQPFGYLVDGKIIVSVDILAKESAQNPIEIKEELQQFVKGKVVDEKGQPLVGASVHIEGKKSGTITDSKGEFSLEETAMNNSILISYVGYVSQTVHVNSLILGTIVLVPQKDVLDEATVQVNTGYQRISRERMTGSFSYVSGERLESKLATNLLNALEGQTAGVVIDKTGNVEVRGVSTFRAQTTPLLVVDGYPVEGNINDLNPTNIASITVLKDGVAASIYGSRAANGVIVITTKAGHKGAPKISYSGFTNIIQKPQLKSLNTASTSDYIDAEIDLFNQDPNSFSTISPYNMSRVFYLLMQARDNKITSEAAMSEIDGLRKVNGIQQIEDAFFRKEINHQHNLALSGGSDDYNYNIAVNYQLSQKNMLNNDSKRIIFDLKNEWKPFSFLTAGAAVNFTVNRANTSSTNIDTPYGPEPIGNNFSTFTVYNINSMLQPYTNLWDQNGNPASVWGLSQFKENTYRNTAGMKNWDYSPLNDINENQFKRNVFSARITGFLRAQIIDGLTAEFGGNWERGNTNIKGIRSTDAYAVRLAYNDATSKANTANHYFPDGAVIDENRNVNESWTLRSQINYNKNFQQDKHRVTALFGNEIRKMTFDNNQLATRFGYNSTAGSYVPVNIKDYLAGIYNSDMLFPSSGFLGITNGEFKYMDNRFVSWYANGSYEYDNRFLLSGSVRLDLTNFFGTDEAYRYKPLWSLGGTYKLSNEKFWNSSVVNKVYIRGSYGINGNISLNNGPFLILSAGAYSPTTGGVAYSVASPPNNQLRWEKTKITNIGLDFGLFDNALEASLDYYKKKSSDLLASDAIDPTLGYSSLVKNVGAMSNHGFELTMNVKWINRDKFSWIMSPIVSYNFNKVDYYKVNRQYPVSYTFDDGILVEGYSAGSLWGYRFAGLNDKGQSQVYTKNNEVVLIGNAGVDDVVYQGTVRPKWDLALTNRFHYQDWSLSFMFIGKLGHKFRKDYFAGSNYQNRHVGERWRQAGDEQHTIYPVLQGFNMDMFYFPYIDEMVGNASYAKLRDATLSYDFSRFSKKIKVANAQVYAQGRNLFRINAKGVDVDTESLGLNVPWEFFMGLRIGF